MFIKYKGYVIEDEYGHYRVTNVDDPADNWTADTVEEAEAEIDEIEEG